MLGKFQADLLFSGMERIGFKLVALNIDAVKKFRRALCKLIGHVYNDDNDDWICTRCKHAMTKEEWKEELIPHAIVMRHLRKHLEKTLKDMYGEEYE